MGILYGLLAALCFGLADFVVARTTRQVGVIQALFAIQLFGVLVVGILIAATVHTPPATMSAWLQMGGISLINFVGTLLLYRAFAIGTLSIVSPIASGFAVVTALLALVSGEIPPLLTLVGVVLLIGGVVVVSRAQGIAGKPSTTGVLEAIGAAFCLGTYFWALNSLTPTLGVLWPIWITRFVQLLCALLVLLITRTPLPSWRHKPTMAFLLLAALLDSGALLAFNVGISQTYTTITTALTSLYSTVAIILAWLFFRERLSVGQWLGIIVVLSGVFIVSI